MSLGINMLSSDTNFVNFTNEEDIIYEEDLIMKVNFIIYNYKL
jgi:hypothetical protein